MKEVIALRPLTYGDRRLQAGERFEASDAYARLMAAFGRVQIVEPRPFVELPRAVVPVEVEEPEPKRRKRTYKRRDMRAED